MRFVTYSISLLLLFAFIGCRKTEQKGPGPDPEEDVTLRVADHVAESILERREAVPRNCGDLEFDPETGESTRVPNVDLVVSHVEIFTTERGTWVRPTIKNLCTARVSQSFYVYISSDDEDDVGVLVPFSNLPPQTDVASWSAVGVPIGSSYTIIVDWDNRIPEANEGNNRCNRRLPLTINFKDILYVETLHVENPDLSAQRLY